jgi:hypothetical protein
VPPATPELPVEVLHVTEETALLSLAVPLTVRVAEDVETMVEAGEPIFKTGGTVSAPVVVPATVLAIPLPVTVLPLPVGATVAVATGGTGVVAASAP